MLTILRVEVEPQQIELLVESEETSWPERSRRESPGERSVIHRSDRAKRGIARLRVAAGGGGFALLALVLLALAPARPAAAAPRAGIDCGCSKTGAYTNASLGRAPTQPDELLDPSVVLVTISEGQSPGGSYTISEQTSGGQTTLTITATGSSTTLLRIQFTATGGEAWGFSPDDDRFVYHFANGSSSHHFQLFDLTSLSNTSGPPVYQTDLDGTWSAKFAPDGGRLVIQSTLGTYGTVFRVVDPSTGDLVFTQGTSGVADTAADFDFLTKPWGFSPNGQYFLFHYLGGASRHYVRVYDLATPAATRTLSYDTPDGSSVLRFSSNSAYLLDAWATGTNATALQVAETSAGTVVYSDSFTFVNNPGNVGDKFKGAAWGFSPKAGNLLYAVDAGPSAVDVHLVDLDAGQQVLLVSSPDVTSGFWEFSPCGDILATVLQNGGGLLGTLHSTLDGSLLYSSSSVLTVLWQFQSTSLAHQSSLDGGAWQLATANTAGDTCPLPPDTTPPVWAPGAVLTATLGASEGTVDLAWPAATDAEPGVALYAILQNGSQIATVPAGTLVYAVTGLGSSGSYTFKVEAEDGATAPNRSTNGPSALIALPDFAAPSWAPGAALVANNLAQTSLDLAWPAAADDSGVSEYRVYRGSVLFATLAGTVTSLSFTGLDWDSDYHFEVEAADASGHVSARLALDVTTAGPPAGAQPPAWPGGASLSVTVTGPETIDLAWPAASGPDGVGAYDVYLNGRRVAQQAGDQTVFSLAGLLPDMDWAFEVVARNTWLQPGAPLSAAGHTAPGTHVEPPIPTPLVSDPWSPSDRGHISSDGRYVSYRAGSAYLYDRVTAEVVSIETELLSGDGRHVVHPDVLASSWVGFLSRDLDSSTDTQLYDVAWGPEPAYRDSGSLRALDVSEAGDRALIDVWVPMPGSPWAERNLLLADGSASTVSHAAVVGRVCAGVFGLCEALDGALLAPDGNSVLYWASTKTSNASPWSHWIRAYTDSGGGTRTLLELSDLRDVGPGSADGSGIVVFATTDSLLPADTPRSSGPVDPYDLDVYALDRVTGTLELVSVDGGGVPVGGQTPSVSADGRFVAYEGGICGPLVIAVRDRWLATTRCVPMLGGADAWSPTLSANGRYLILESNALAVEGGVHLVDLAWQRPSWPVPSSIVMTGHDLTSIDFTWTPVEDTAEFSSALGYYTIYKDGSVLDWVPVTDFAPGILPSYSATGLSPATAYSFEVELRDASDGETSDGPQAVFDTTTPSADLSLSIVDSPDPIGTATQLRYDITLSNAGPDTAFAAGFDFSWPSGMGFVAANPRVGSCNRPTPESLACVVGDVPAGGSVQVVVLLSTGAQGTADVSAAAYSLGIDPNPGNNTDVHESTEVVLDGGGTGGGGAGMVGSGPDHAGSVVGWGDSTYGQAEPPLAVAQRTARSVAAGASHSCAIQAETGAVVCWGRNTNLESTPPPSVDGTLGTAVALAVGGGLSCAIQAGTQAVVCWGANGFGQATPDPSVDGSTGGAVALAVSWNHACAIRADTGAVVCWGFNGNHELDVPSSVNGIAGTASAIAVGKYHSCAIQAGTHAVTCWGAALNDFGQTSVPSAVDGSSGSASALEAGPRNTCAVQEGTGKVFCWGDGWYALYPPPSSVDGTTGTASAVAVADSACAIQSGTGAVVCWGTVATTPPSQVNGDAGTATAIVGRESHFCAIQTGTRAAICWGGSNAFGETSVPAAVNGSGGLAIAVAAGADHSCAISAATGAVVCWGDGTFGQTSVPAGVDGVGGTARALALGAFHGCAIQSGTGATLCWGSNTSGETNVPADVDGSLGSARGIAAGGAHSCAIQDVSDAVVCWGDGTLGQTSVPAEVDGSLGSAEGIAAGDAHSCAIQAETGIVFCWGDDGAGQATVPAELDGSGGTASAVAAGDAHSCAIQKQTGAVVCWGDDTSGQSTPPAGVDGSGGHALAITGGHLHSCAIQAGTRSLLCWGEDGSGQASSPASVDGTAIAVAGGGAHTLAIAAPEPSSSVLGAASLATLLALARRRRRH
jgi:alpha-tubulin suppressor-like RCC1 family protein